MMHAERVQLMEKENQHNQQPQQRQEQSSTHHVAPSEQQQRRQSQYTANITAAASPYSHSNRSIDSSNSYNNSNDWIEKTANLQQAFAKLVTKTTCRLCSVYADRQAEYEITMERAWKNAASSTTNATAGAFGNMNNGNGNSNNHMLAGFDSYFDSDGATAASTAGNNNQNNSLEVELYRQFLFDEVEAEPGSSVGFPDQEQVSLRSVIKGQSTFYLL